MIVELMAVSIVTIVGLYTSLRFIWRESNGIPNNLTNQATLSSRPQMGIREGRPTKYLGRLNRAA